MPTTKPTIPKNIAALIARESELQASVDRWSVESFRQHRDQLESTIRTGAATDEQIAEHARSRDGGETDRHFQSMCASSSSALDSFRHVNWETFREFLRARLEARRQREQSIVEDVQSLREKHGILIDFSDDQSATTSQLAAICEREDVGYIRFGSAAETF
jgi:hypothetical protein